MFPLRRVAGWLWVPLPFVGSLYPLIRTLAPSDQDLSSGPYRTMREALEGEPTLGPQELVELVKRRFDLSVHRRSIERALARAKKKGQC